MLHFQRRQLRLIFCPVRARTRQHVRKASRGDRQAFVRLIDEYFNFVIEYGVLSGLCAEEEAPFFAQGVFSNIWEKMAQMSRVSEFERALFVHLEACDRIAEPAAMRLVQRIQALRPVERLILVARELENWETRFLALCLETSQADVDDKVLATRCAIAGINLEAFQGEELACLRELSKSFCMEIDGRQCRSQSRVLGAFPRVRDLKAQWLEIKGVLIDLRQRIRPYRAEREAWVAGVFELLPRKRGLFGRALKAKPGTRGPQPVPALTEIVR